MEGYEQFLREVKACLKCGEKQPCNRTDKNGIYLHCHACKYETKSHPTLIGAMDEWNGCKDPLFSKNEGE